MLSDKSNVTVTELDREFIAGTYNRFPVVLTKGHGSRVIDENGKEYIDMGTGIGVTSFGYCDKEWVKAVTMQASTLQHTSNLYYTSPCAVLAEKLCKKTGMSKVFFGNSGAEANECAIKLARKYAAEKKGSDCFTIVSLKNSFHGRTLTTLAATGQDHYHELFNPLTPGFVSIEAGNIEALRELEATSGIAGVIFECIQGEGGVNVIDNDFLAELAKFAAEKDIILIADEVQTGNGRTGKLYSYMNTPVTPDVITTAKGLGGGLPIGAAIMNEKLSHVLGFGDHGSTFGGNPVACAGAITVIDRLDDEFLASVAAKGKLLKELFEGADGIEAVSGTGLMIGLKTKKPAGGIVKKCLEKGVLCLTAKDKVRLLPALNIPVEDLKVAARIILEASAEA